MPSFRTPALLALVLVIGLIAGCGGGRQHLIRARTAGATGATGDSSASSTSADSGDYAGQVDAALAEFNKNYSSLGNKAANPSSADDYLDTVNDAPGRDRQRRLQPERHRAARGGRRLPDDLVSAFEDLSKGLDPVIKATEDKDQEALISAAGAFATASTISRRRA